MKEFLKFSFGCFGVFLLIIFGIILFFTLRYFWESSSITYYTNRLDRYKEAQKLITDNLDLIKEEVNYQPPDTMILKDGTIYISKENIVSFTEVTFGGYLDKPKLGELKPIQKLWEDRLMSETWGDIVVRANQNIEFNIKDYHHGIFFEDYFHYIVYAPNQKPAEFLANSVYRVLANLKELEKDWYYVVIENIPD